jgi:hypothetical protein
MTDTPHRPLLPSRRGIAATAESFDGIFEAVNQGQITLSEARDYIDLLRARHDILEAAEIDRRIAALERDDA